MSSLANQLQSIASLDASRLTSRTGAPSSKSYLFPPRKAADHDLDSIFSLAQSGFEELLELDPDMGEFEDELFSEKAKRVDRMMLTIKENEEMGVLLGRCLRRLGKWVGILAGGKCLEWLVRRFRVHEMNAEAVLQTFLPYHDSPNFARMLAILTIPPESPYYAPFSPLIKNAQPLPRSYIITAISPAREKSLRLMGDVLGMMKQALEQKTVHRALLAFWSASIVELLGAARKGKGVPEGMVKLLVETFVGILSTLEGGQDVNAAVYPPLLLLTRTIRLADGPFLALLSALITPGTGANPSQRILTLLVVLHDRPGWIQGLGEKGCQRLSQVKLLGPILVSAAEKYGLETAINVILHVMLERPESNRITLQELISCQRLQPSAVRIMAEQLLVLGRTTNVTPKRRDLCKMLLSDLHERHPAVVDSARIDAPEQCIDDDMLARGTSSSRFVDVYSADVTTRVSGIQAMFAISNDMEASEEDRTAAVDAILALLSDEAEPIIAAIHSRPDQLLSVIRQRESIAPRLSSGDPYIDGVRPQFRKTQPDSAIIQHTLRFMADTYLPQQPDVAPEIFEKLMFPALLITRRRHVFKSGNEAFISVVNKINSLSGVSQLFQTIWSVINPTKDEFSTFNVGLSKALAAGIVNSPDSTRYRSFLSACLSDPDYNIRLLSHLVIGQIIQLSEGFPQVTVALSVLRTLRTNFGVIQLNDLDGDGSMLSPSVCLPLYDKPEEPNATRQATLGVLVAMGGVVRPSSQVFDWLAADGNDQYPDFCTQLYQLVNSGGLPAAVAEKLLRSLLVHIGEDALVFFASVWTAGGSTALRVAALRHATSFVAAYKASNRGMDFQLSLPAILIALHDQDVTVRESAAGLLQMVADSMEGVSDVYALDTFYGHRSDKIQLLKQSDLRTYLAAMLASLDEIVLDRKRLLAVHTASLDPRQSTNKKDSSHRRAVLASLLSHVTAWQSIRQKEVLLEILSGVHSPVIFRGILPLLRPLGESDSQETIWLSKHDTESRGRYIRLLFDTLNARSAAALSDTGSDSRDLVFGFVSRPNATELGRLLRTTCISRMRSGVFGALGQVQQVAFVMAVLVSLQGLSSDDAQLSKHALEHLTIEAPALIQLIHDLSQPLDVVVRAKKQKHEESETTQAAQAVADLTVLIDSREWSTVGSTGQLVSALMSVLSALLAKRQTIKDGVEYLEQEVLSAVLAVLERIQSNSELQKAQVGIEVIIKVIRASSNPRTAQRALLVAAELARLMPDAVLHNVMPIFTFMGSSDLQRDDAYSFGVVEKTVSCIVPVMAQSLRDKASTKLELFIESLPFLSIFTDMASRLPKHRTLPFFSHLVTSLGTDFLAPISILLVGRTTIKALKAGPMAQALDLPLSIVNHFDTPLRLEVMLESLAETARLVSDVDKTEGQEGLLSRANSEGDALRTVRQITALLTFVTELAHRLVRHKYEQSQVEEVIGGLIGLGSLLPEALREGSNVNQHILVAIQAALQLLPAERFLAVIAHLLGDEQEQKFSLVLGVFVERLPMIKAEHREASAVSMAEIIKQCSSRLGSPATTATARSALAAIVSSARSTEDPALSQVMPAIVRSAAIKGSSSPQQAEFLALLVDSIRHLGSRIIPYIQSAMDLCLEIVRNAKSSATIAKEAFAVFATLVETVPTFLNSKQIKAMMEAAIDHRERDDAISTKFISISAKRIPTKNLFGVILELWQPVKSKNNEAMTAFFDLLRLTLRNANGQSVSTLVRQIFAFFLEVFDFRHDLKEREVSEDIVNQIETSAIGSFLELVTKLNEGTFKPLFVRLYDWAVVHLADEKPIADPRLIERKTVLLRVMMGLLQKFKHLLSPYMGTLQPHIDELLPAFAEGVISDQRFWTMLLKLLATSYEVDEGAYWDDALHLKMVPQLVAQLSLFPDLNSTAESPISHTLASLAKSTTSEPVLKKLNTSICLVTRTDVPRTRIAALRALDAIWEKQADELLPFVPETVSEFLAELLEDENSEVEGLARKVLARIEKLTGSLKEYLE